MLRRALSSCAVLPTSTSKNLAAVVIPARLASKRFPAKPLAMICGEPLVVHTLRRAQAASRVSRVIVATDHEEIVRVVREAGGEAIMTSCACNTGTQRVSEASLILPPEFSVVINVQGDEPLVDPAHIDLLAHYLVSTHDRQQLPSELWRASETVTLAAPIQSVEQFLSPHVVKVVTAAPAPTSNEGPEWGGVRRALYFSRAPVPHLKPRFFETRSACSLEERGGMGRQARRGVGAGEELRGAAMLAALQGPLRHVGMYGFRRRFLEELRVVPPSFLQDSEDLEQLQLLEAGHVISLFVVSHASPDVNIPEDILAVKRVLAERKDSIPQQKDKDS